MVASHAKVIAEHLNVEEMIWKEKEQAVAVSSSFQAKFTELETQCVSMDEL